MAIHDNVLMRGFELPQLAPTAASLYCVYARDEVHRSIVAATAYRVLCKGLRRVLTPKPPSRAGSSSVRVRARGLLRAVACAREGPAVAASIANGIVIMRIIVVGAVVGLGIAAPRHTIRMVKPNTATIPAPTAAITVIHPPPHMRVALADSRGTSLGICSRLRRTPHALPVDDNGQGEGACRRT